MGVRGGSVRFVKAQKTVGKSEWHSFWTGFLANEFEQRVTAMKRMKVKKNNSDENKGNGSSTSSGTSRSRAKERTGILDWRISETLTKDFHST
jgi:hypothetical protein